MVQKEAQTPFVQRAARLTAAEALGFYKMGLDVTWTNPDTKEKIHELTKENVGIIGLTNHWGLMEFPLLARFFYLNKDLRKTKLLMPFSAHQYRPGLARMVEKWTDTQLSMTMTDDAEEYYKNHPEIDLPRDADTLNAKFVKDAAETLKPGGTVILSPQGKRQPFFPASFDRTMLGTFFMGLSRSGVDFNNVGFLFIGTGLKGIDNLEPWKDTEWKEKHPHLTVNVGGLYRYSETPFASGKPLRKADAWARDELAKTIPTSNLADSQNTELVNGTQVEVHTPNAFTSRKITVDSVTDRLSLSNKDIPPEVVRTVVEGLFATSRILDSVEPLAARKLKEMQLNTSDSHQD